MSEPDAPTPQENGPEGHPTSAAEPEPQADDTDVADGVGEGPSAGPTRP